MRGWQKREQGNEEHWRDTDQALEAVLLRPVRDERGGDKEKEETPERGNGGVKKGQHKRCWYSFLSPAVGEGFRASDKCQSPQNISAEQESSADELSSSVLSLRHATPKWSFSIGIAISEQCKCSVKTATFKCNDHQTMPH